MFRDTFTLTTPQTLQQQPETPGCRALDRSLRNATPRAIRRVMPDTLRAPTIYIRGS